MKVSIVTPSYNQAAFLEQTIQSVLNQTYRDIEYIIIDGCSTDGSEQIIKKYAHKLAYYEIQPDRGQAHAINKGFEKSNGQIFAYLNSDDLLELNAVENIVKAFERYQKAALIYGMCSNIDENGELISGALGGHISYKEMLTQKMLPKIHQPACFFNRDFLTRKPLFREDLNYAMDYELILWLMKDKEVHFIPQPIARFRYHKASKTVSQVGKAYREKMQVQRQYAPWLMPLWGVRYAKYLVKHVVLGK